MWGSSQLHGSPSQTRTHPSHNLAPFGPKDFHVSIQTHHLRIHPHLLLHCGVFFFFFFFFLHCRLLRKIVTLHRSPAYIRDTMNTKRRPRPLLPCPNVNSKVKTKGRICLLGKILPNVKSSQRQNPSTCYDTIVITTRICTMSGHHFFFLHFRRPCIHLLDCH